MTLDNGRWAPGIGDPTIVGWITVVVYLLCAVLCFWAASRRKIIIYRREERETNPAMFWLLLGGFLLLLGINKQLDLQSLFTQIGRDLALAQGWYNQRTRVQFIFIGALAFIGFASLLLGIRWLRHAGFAVKLALGGCTFLFGFVLLRASSFHHMDTIIGVTLGGARLNWVFELGSLGIIFIAATMALLIRHPQP